MLRDDLTGRVLLREDPRVVRREDRRLVQPVLRVHRREGFKASTAMLAPESNPAGASIAAMLKNLAIFLVLLC